MVRGPVAEASPSTRGRIPAALYLVVHAGGITAQVFISDRLVVHHDAARTSADILANSSLYRLDFTIFISPSGCCSPGSGDGLNLLGGTLTR